MTELTKWPRLIVVGEPVTPEQADEVLVRTNSWGGHTNDRAFERDVLRLAGIEATEHGWADYTSVAEFERRHGVLDLHYLSNSRVYSSWIGGPHGWCDWGGSVGCSTYNIGKWPSVEEVVEDWGKIAVAFPYLDLTAQLVTDEGEGHVAVTHRVRDGGVEELRHAGQVAPARDDDLLRGVAQLAWGSRSRERGVDLERLRAALERTRLPT